MASFLCSDPQEMSPINRPATQSLYGVCCPPEVKRHGGVFDIVFPRTLVPNMSINVCCPRHREAL